MKIVIIFLEDFFFYFTALQFLLNSMSWQKKKNKFPSLTGISLRPNFKRWIKYVARNLTGIKKKQSLFFCWQHSRHYHHHGCNIYIYVGNILFFFYNINVSVVIVFVIIIIIIIIFCICFSYRIRIKGVDFLFLISYEMLPNWLPALLTFKTLTKLATRTLL